MAEAPVVIVAPARTPMGGLKGSLAVAAAPTLGATAPRAVIDSGGAAADSVDAALMGCVLSVGLDQAPARQAALGADLVRSTCCTSVNKMCGSGRAASMRAHALLAGVSADLVVAGGVESMSNAPYLLDRPRAGCRMGRGQRDRAHVSRRS